MEKRRDAIDLIKMRKWIEEGQKKAGGKRPFGKALEVDYQKIDYWYKDAKKLFQFIRFMTRLRRYLKIPVGKFWGEVEREALEEEE